MEAAAFLALVQGMAVMSVVHMSDTEIFCNRRFVLVLHSRRTLALPFVKNLCLVIATRRSSAPATAWR